jgi:proteasome regulatory subunit
MLDEAILRPGRFDRLIEVPKPDEAGREAILRIHAEGMNVADDVDYGALAADLPGYSGADIAALATEAGMFAIRDDRTTVRAADFEAARDKLDTTEGTDEVPGVTDYRY